MRPGLFLEAGDAEWQPLAIRLRDIQKLVHPDRTSLKTEDNFLILISGCVGEGPTACNLEYITKHVRLARPEPARRGPQGRTADGPFVDQSATVQRKTQQMAATWRTARKLAGAAKFKVDGLPLHAAIARCGGQRGIRIDTDSRRMMPCDRAPACEGSDLRSGGVSMCASTIQHSPLLGRRQQERDRHPSSAPRVPARSPPPRFMMILGIPTCVDTRLTATGRRSE